ncbi:hypothetical protein Tsubulata_040660 [Turnera subulata]|uniref:Uncharacterized protein n=1 Tax=Turnera subulata TaxID=218843 RepID=A0A9Q0G3B3_9ROSI|nr:hypothetical protein Tsubulata_040660 [Turnera subulata]
MATTLLSVPTPHQKTLFSQPWLHGSTITLIRYPSTKPLICLSASSSSSSSTSVVEEGPSVAPPTLPSSPDATPDQPESTTADAVKLPLRGCKACGKEEIENGCNGEGRIQGGIATVPGFGWWPIKAYRPCPAYLASGGRYRRQGQSMDEVVSGGAQRNASAVTSDETR